MHHPLDNLQREGGGHAAMGAGFVKRDRKKTDEGGTKIERLFFWYAVYNDLQ